MKKFLENKNIIRAQSRISIGRTPSHSSALRSSPRRGDSLPVSVARPPIAVGGHRARFPRQRRTEEPRQIASFSPASKDSRPYRENVVGFILNRRNDILIMKRAGARWHWQLPQGGVEPTETKLQAVLREMKEETGLKGLRVIGVVENFHAYDWPKAPLYAGDEFRGQRQTLFFLRYIDKGLRISLDPKEATGSRWVPVSELLKWIAPVRQVMAKKALHSYQQLFKKI
ncbi:MAG: NUDIX domain-containing protein [bacterium]|nr:NUDIX domain-containing protein [bacterium]